MQALPSHRTGLKSLSRAPDAAPRAARETFFRLPYQLNEPVVHGAECHFTVRENMLV
jgi:hypothetical protein